MRILLQPTTAAVLPADGVVFGVPELGANFAIDFANLAGVELVTLEFQSAVGWAVEATIDITGALDALGAAIGSLSGLRLGVGTWRASKTATVGLVGFALHATGERNG